MPAIRKISAFVKSFLNTGGQRSAVAKRNVLWMILIKGGSILAGMLLVPITLDYVDKDTYGIWLTLSSMVAWFAFFDVGLNQGLRNRLTESLAHGNTELGKKYVSTTYALLTMIFIPLMIILLLVVPHVNWSSLLNIETANASGLASAAAIIITYFCINFILSTVNVVILADQKPADAALRSFIQQLASVLIIFILTKTTEGSLINLCAGLCLAPLLIIIIFNLALFKGRYKSIAPSIRSIDFKIVPDLMKLGVQFFIIQIAAIVQFQMNNFLIQRYFGEVTEYNIAYKYFSILTMAWSILVAPIWSAVTDAIAKKDYEWIKRTKSNYLKLFCLFAMCGPLMLVISQPVYHIWVSDRITITMTLSFWVMIYNLVTMFSTIFVDILNGAGELKIQTIASCISPFIFLLTAHCLYKMGCGVESIIIASIVANFNGFIIAPIQCRHYLKDKTNHESTLDS